jgi:Na+-translocating ferredoxin:NAD+ oxidoreductase subunit G
MKKILHLTVFLALISALAGGVLAYVNQITDPIIQEQKIAKVKASLQEIFPGTSEFKEVSFEDESGKVTNAYEAVGKGYAFAVSVTGYKDTISFIVGYDQSGKVAGFKITYLNDTPGIGSRIGEAEFTNGIVGKNATDQVDTLSGATVSSKAVVTGLEAAAAAYAALSK